MVSASRDSVAVVTESRHLSVVDSVFRQAVLLFDTLEVQIERPAYLDSPPQSMSLRAVGGQLRGSSQQSKEVNESVQVNDSTAVSGTSREAETNASDSVTVAKPPDMTLIISLFFAIIGCLIALMVVFVFILRRRRK